MTSAPCRQLSADVETSAIVAAETQSTKILRNQAYTYTLHLRTRSSAVAVIADRTAYDVRYTGKLSNRFRLQVYERMVYARSDSTGRVYERSQILSTQERPLSVTDRSSVLHEISE